MGVTRVVDDSAPDTMHAVEVGDVPVVEIDRPEVVPRRGLVLPVVGLGALPIIVGCVLIIVRRSWAGTPAGDGALTEIAVRHASRLGQLLGPYSRFGWHHPGPLMFYVLVPAWAALGSHQAGLYLGALIINGVCLALITVLVHRRLGVRAALAASALGCAYVLVAGAHVISYPWNPVVVVVPLALFVVAGALAVESRPWALVVAVVAATFVVQSDVGPGLPVAAMAVVIAGAVVWHWRGAAVRAVGASIAALVLLWLPVLIEQVTDSPGNAGRLVSFFRHSPAGQAQGTRAAAGLYTVGLTVFPWGQGGALDRVLTEPTGPRVIASAVFLLLLAVGAVVGLRTGRRLGGWMCVIVLVGCGAALPAMFAIRGPAYVYLVYWLAGLALVGWLGIAFSLAAAGLGALSARTGSARHRHGRPASGRVAARWSLALLSVALVVAALGATSTLARDSSHRPWVFDDSSQSNRLSTRTIGYLHAHHLRHPLVVIGDDSWPTSAVLVDDLDRAGVAVSVPRRWSFMYDPRFADDGRADVRLRVVSAATVPAGTGGVVVRQGSVAVVASTA